MSATPRSRSIRLLTSALAVLMTQAAQAAPPAASSAPPAPQDVQPPNPWDQAQRAHVTQALREGKSPAAILPMLALWEQWDRATPAVTSQALTQLASNPRLLPSLRIYAGALQARADLRQGRPDEAQQAMDALGYISRWRILGPFDNEGKQGFGTVLPPEAHPMAPTDPEVTFPGRERSVGWRDYPDVPNYGAVSLDSVLRPTHNVCGFAETFVHSKRAQTLTLWTGAGGASKVYWNGEEVAHDDRYRAAPDPDRHVVVVAARAGLNRVLVKTCVTDQTWAFYFRLGDATGGVAQGVEATLEPFTLDDTLIPARRLPAAPKAPLEMLEAALARRPTDASAMENLARFLHNTRADESSTRRAKQLAKQAAHAAPSLPRIQLAIELAEARSEKLKLVSLAQRHFSDAAETSLLLAAIESEGPEPEKALRRLDALTRPDIVGLQAAELRSNLLGQLGLHASALAIWQPFTSTLRESPGHARRLAQLAAQAGHEDEALTHYARRLEGRFDDVGAHRILLHDALASGDTGAAYRHVDALRTLSPLNTSLLRHVSKTYDALGRNDLALQTLQEAMRIAPEDAQLHVEYAQFLLRARQTEAAAEALRETLRLQPQDAFAREQLEQLQPASRRDEAFAADADTLLARRREKADYPSRILHDLSVNTVYENGLGSRFRQLAVQVHDAEGARRWRSHSIQFDPATQRVQIRLARVYRPNGGRLEAVQTFEQPMGEPWYRLYYDTRALVVWLPDLEPGDVVELRYRVDDVAHRNLFADYYGDTHLLQGPEPTAHAEYVLVAPTSRDLYFQVPELKGLERSQWEDGGQRITRFVAQNLPAIHGESGMPGATEISPYLHVSTYRNWHDVGRWYWGLIKDQLTLDSALEREVEDLVSDASTTREKVARIYHWVLAHTRYVGLEFGIHGFMPYRVTQVAQRGFGDCKDKASLLYAMLTHAGVDARIVLIRTRRNGDIASEPASLAVFDHAIAYVPELDLYLDGTAEHSGITELPAQDQGVMVLHVGPAPEDILLTRTPVLPSAHNRRTRKLEVHVAADGSARLEGQEEVSGGEAAGYRNRYQAAGTRTERLERSLAGAYPGLQLKSQHFEGLDALEQPVRYRYQALVPQLGRWDGDQLRLAPSGLSELVRGLAARPQRRYPLDVGGAHSLRETRRFRLAEGLAPQDLPEGGVAKSVYGRLSLRFETNGPDVMSHVELDLERDRIAPADYPAFRKWVEEADLLLRQRIVIRRNSP